MRNIPTKNELIDFLKSQRKTIFISIGVAILSHFLLVGYNLYGNLQNDPDLEEQYLEQNEIYSILERDPEEISVAELREVEDALEKDRSAFSMFIELENQETFNNPNALREFLIVDETVAKVEAMSGYSLGPIPSLVVNVEESSGIQTIIIGSGDVEANKEIARAYRQLLINGEVPLIQDKIVYEIGEEVEVIEEQTFMEIISQNVASTSPLTVVIGSVLSMIIGTIIGVFIALIRTIYQKEIPLLYGYELNDSDTILLYSKLKNVDENNIEQSVAHAINRNQHKKKLILAQHTLSEELKNSIEESIPVFQELSEANPLITVDEVIILTRQNKTLKSWYENQRLKIERLNVPVTVIQY